jgi:hypothetical protein
MRKEVGMDWKELKTRESEHHKKSPDEVALIDLYKSGGLLRDFAIGCIIKYAYRNRSGLEMSIRKEDIEKIKHYADMLLIVEEESSPQVESPFDPWNPDSYAKDGFSPKKHDDLPAYPCKRCGHVPEYSIENRGDGKYYRYRCTIYCDSITSLVSGEKARREWNEIYSAMGSQEKIFSG